MNRARALTTLLPLMLCAYGGCTPPSQDDRDNHENHLNAATIDLNDEEFHEKELVYEDSLEGISEDELEQKILSLEYDDGEPRFTPFDIADYHTHGAPLDYVFEAAQIMDLEENFFFSPEQISKFYDTTGSVNDAAQLAKINDGHGKSLFTGEAAIEFKKSGGSAQYAQVVSSVVVESDGTPTYNPRDLAFLFKGVIPIDTVKAYAKLRRTPEKPFFTGQDLAIFVKAGGSKDEARYYIENTAFDGRLASRWYQLELNEHEQGHDEIAVTGRTRKPDAIIIYPYYNYNSAFEDKASVDHFKELRRRYDLWVRIAETDDEVFTVMNLVSDPILLEFYGHGNPLELRLGKPKEGEEWHEQYAVDISDEEFTEPLQRLPRDATIFLGGCLNGKSLSGTTSLAVFFKEISNGKRVLAAAGIYDSSSVQVRSVLPLDLRIVTREGDITYASRPLQRTLK